MPSLQSRLYLVPAWLAGIYTDFALGRSIELMRESAKRGPGAPRDIQLVPASASGVPCEWVIPPNGEKRRVILYLHGGGWIMGWGNAHRRMVAQLDTVCDARALAVDYRLAPENPFPAALDDCVAAYRWLLQSGVSPGNIVIAGDSAGGNLTLTTMLVLRESGDPLPAAAVCLSPAADLSPDQRLPSAGGTTVMLRGRAGRIMAESYVANQDPCQPLISPVYADLRGLPSLLIHVGGDEFLRESAVRFAERARAADVDVTLKVWPGMWHVWHIFSPGLPEAKEAIAHIGDFVREKV